jgi:hypothetical protein
VAADETDDTPRATIPRWTGLAVFVVVVLAVVAVLLLEFKVPKAQRPTILTPHTTVITVTTTQTPSP